MGKFYSTAFLIGPKQKMIQFWILFLFFTSLCAGVESESEYDDYYEYYDEKEQKISAEWKTLATEMFEGMDTDKNNYTTAKEFKKYWSQAHTEREVYILSSVFPAVDDNQSGVLEFEEILKNGKKIIVKSGLLGMMWYLLKKADSEESLGKITINAPQLKQNWQNRFQYFTQEELQRIIDELDLNSDGRIHHIELLLYLDSSK